MRNVVRLTVAALQALILWNKPQNQGASFASSSSLGSSNEVFWRDAAAADKLFGPEERVLALSGA
jgi:hypothetical protein